MFPEWTWLVGLLIGAAIGSFLNVVIYRTPRNLSLNDPKFSFCPKCKHRLTVLDLFPLFSWLFLKGKCRHCGAPVAARYFIVELINGSIWAWLWHQYFVATWDPATGIAYALAAATLVAIIFIDLEFYIIPDTVNGFLALVGIGYNAYLYIAGRPEATTWGMPSALAGWLTGIAVLWGIALFGRVLFKKDSMGHGDIKMARGIGAVLFPTVAVMGFGLAVLLGAVLGVAQVMFRRQPDAGAEEDVDEGDVVPESIPSLLRCGLGYVLGIDLIGQYIPSLYRRWFGEEARLEFEEIEDFEADRTMIPFGPYLALGAILAASFRAPLMDGVQAYLNWAGIGKKMEQSLESPSLQIREPGSTTP